MLSEEEKQAIEFFEKRKNICLENANICDENDYDGEAEYLREEKMYIDTVLNIIAKLQKENKELKQENKELNRLLKFSLDYRHKLEEDLYEGASNFIVRKDKIREKLKKLIKKLNEPNNDRWEKDDNIYYDKIKCQIRILKELLEGDKNG